jgi:hypothetical protein
MDQRVNQAPSSEESVLRALSSALAPLDQVARFWLPVGAIAVATTVGVVGWSTQPDRFARGYAPSQPIPYSHRLHAGTLQIPCEYCHSDVRRSRHASVPPVDTCMNCHRMTKTDSPAIRQLAEAQATGQPIAWQRIHLLPDHVYFDHRPHVAAGIRCQTCHGPVETMDVTSQQMSMRMGNCLGCHRDPKAALPPDSPIRRGPEDCSTCHR